ncbi:hypothetical protein FOB72_17855 (plasmid) [Cupriavidus pauculus]|uniref:Uncharacterized protein n=1 Tax=Cupriavidus pauculus TaxID=82633 RepID=A0A5P2H9Q0_9BURK|nr:hypothetical protein [Cupriavidus pauculus]QET04019.1 hypothetical protein FOB72_17855 [Cupriavidus pauculus]
MSISVAESQSPLALRRIFVTCQRMPVVAIAFSNGKPWQPLRAPLFTRHEGLQLCQYIRSLSFDKSRNAFALVEDGRVTWFDVSPQVIDGKMMEFYTIGPDWGWKLSEVDRVPSGEPLFVNVRPAVLEWIQSLAADAYVGQSAFCSFLIAGYVEQRMELQHALDLSRFEALLCIASKTPVGPNVVRVAVVVESRVGIVDALAHLSSDATFNALALQHRRERIVEAMLDQLAREVAGI